MKNIFNAVFMLTMFSAFSVSANAEKVSKYTLECNYNSVSSINENGKILRYGYSQTSTSNNVKRTSDNGVTSTINSEGNLSNKRTIINEDGSSTVNSAMEYAYLRENQRSITDLGANRYSQLELMTGLKTAKDGFSFNNPDGTKSKTREIKTKIETVYFDDGTVYKQESLKIDGQLQIDEGNYTMVESEEDGYHVTTQTLTAPYTPSDDPQSTIESAVSVCKSKSIN